MNNPDLNNPQDVTRAVMRIVTQPDPRAAFALAAALPKTAAFFPEAAMLLNTPGLDDTQRRAMAQAQDAEEAMINARLGMLGFSFPRWRFTAQGMGGPSLLEQFGMTRLARTSDRFDPAAPPTPQNDRLGTGFVTHGSNGTFELRRSYILCADRTAEDGISIVIRNNSWFFGRDRLPAPVYVAWRGLKREELEAVDERTLTGPGPWQAWPAALEDRDGTPPRAEKLRRIAGALDHIDDCLYSMDSWLHIPEGRAALADTIATACARQQAQGKDTPPFYLTALPAAEAPWQPQASVAATAAIASALRGRNAQEQDELKDLFSRLAQPGMRLELLSGPAGDFPAAPAQPKPQL